MDSIEQSDIIPHTHRGFVAIIGRDALLNGLVAESFLCDQSLLVFGKSDTESSVIKSLCIYRNSRIGIDIHDINMIIVPRLIKQIANLCKSSRLSMVTVFPTYCIARDCVLADIIVNVLGETNENKSTQEGKSRIWQTRALHRMNCGPSNTRKVAISIPKSRTGQTYSQVLITV